MICRVTFENGRIMMNRKTLSHGELVTEVVGQLSGRIANLRPLEIRRRIVYLIEKDHFHRDDNNRQLYHYSLGNKEEV